MAVVAFYDATPLRYRHRLAWWKFEVFEAECHASMRNAECELALRASEHEAPSSLPPPEGGK